MTRSSNRFEKHSGKLLAALWIVSLVAGLAILEWSLRPAGQRYKASATDAGPAPARHLVLREWKRNTDYQFAPTPERKRYQQGGLQDIYRLSTDSEGFIEPARRHQRPDASIVFLGGSTTECMLVAPENRFPYLAARKLEDALGIKVNGINAGLSGNNSMHSLLLMLGKVIPLRPDFVVFMEAANDIGALSSYGTYWIDRGSLRIIENDEISVGKAMGVLGKSLIPYTLQMLKDARRSVRGLFRVGPANAETAARNESSDMRERQRVMARDFESSLRTFARTTLAWGITPVFMTQVNVQAKSEAERGSDFLNRQRLGGAVQRPEDFASVHDHFNAIVREVASSEGVALIDLVAARDWAFGDVYDAVHFNDYGSQQVAEIVAAALKDKIAAKIAKPANAGGKP